METQDQSCALPVVFRTEPRKEAQQQEDAEGDAVDSKQP